MPRFQRLCALVGALLSICDHIAYSRAQDVYKGVHPLRQPIKGFLSNGGISQISYCPRVNDPLAAVRVIREASSTVQSEFDFVPIGDDFIHSCFTGAVLTSGKEDADLPFVQVSVDGEPAATLRRWQHECEIALTCGFG